MSSTQVNNYLTEAKTAVKKYLYTAATVKRGVKLAPLLEHDNDANYFHRTIACLLPDVKCDTVCSPSDVKQKSCLHAVWKYRADTQGLHHEPGHKMKEYMEKYASRPLQMYKLLSPQDFCNEYQQKKVLCQNYKFVGLVLSSKSENCTVGTMISKAQHFLQSLDKDYGYIVTLHDPSIDTVQKLDLFNDTDREFDDAEIKAHFGPECQEAKTDNKSPESGTKMTTRMSPDSCFKGEMPEHISPRKHICLRSPFHGP
jgi:RNase H-fold protein (predicted Holliday junction resolvase)